MSVTDRDAPVVDLPRQRHSASSSTAPPPPPRPPGEPVAGGSAVQRAVRRFALASAVALVVVGVGTVYLSSAIARSEVLRDAARIGHGVAHGLVGPQVTDAVVAGDPAALRRLDEVVRHRMSDGTIVRVKVWDRSGRIVYADDRRLVGRVFPLEAEDRALFGQDRAEADVSNLTGSENVLERQFGRLIEVYSGFRTASGDELLFEAYLPLEKVDDESDALRNQVVPLSIGSLLVIQLLTLPLAISLARRVDRVQGERRRMLQHAVDASEVERRRIAQDLHDGVIQDLAGIGYVLAASRQALADGDAEPVRRSLDRAITLVTRDVEALRVLATDIYPPDLADGGLETAVGDLLGELSTAGLATAFSLEVSAPLSHESATLAYRVVREALRNVARHAAARSVDVRVWSHEGRLRVVVADDGAGFDPDRVATPRGHLGLQVLRDTVADAGGRVEVWSVPGGGTTVRGSLPLA